MANKFLTKNWANEKNRILLAKKIKRYGTSFAEGQFQLQQLEHQQQQMLVTKMRMDAHPSAHPFFGFEVLLYSVFFWEIKRPIGLRFSSKKPFEPCKIPKLGPRKA